MRSARVARGLLPLLILVLPGCAGRATPVGRASALPSGGIRLVNVAPARGIRHTWKPQPRPVRILEAIGRGCAFLDYDQDGWLDVLLVDAPGPRLFRNRGDGQFEESTSATRLSPRPAEWHGCAVGDVDGDGFPDLLLAGYRCLALFRNDAGRRWRDVTAAAGLDPGNRGHWATSAGFMDLDADGRVELVLLNFVVFGPGEQQYCQFKPGIRSGCPTGVYRPQFAELWRNVGRQPGRPAYRDVTPTSGFGSTHGKGLVLAFADANDDGRVDLYLGNDGVPSDLMVNQGGLRFRNRGLESGVAYGSVKEEAISAMGADWADFDRDGRLDLVVTAFANQPYSLLRAVGGGQFEHAGDRTGITALTFRPLGFGANWFEMDNDGWPDLVFANGHVYDNTEQIDPLTTFRQPLMLLHNQQGAQFIDLVPDLGGDLAVPRLGRGTARGDFDNDGRDDLLVVDFEGQPLLLRNETRGGNHWLTLDLRGRGANRQAYGARVTIRAGERVWVADLSPACSYLSSSDPRLHFGLGETTSLDTVTVRWPSGRRETIRGVEVDRILTLHEGAGARQKS